MGITVSGPNGVNIDFPDGTPPETIRDVMARATKSADLDKATPASAASDAGEQIVRGINRGLNNVLSLPGAIVGGAVNLVAPGQGDRFLWDNQASRFLSSPDSKPTTQAGRFADSVGQAIGSSVVPMAGIAAKAAQPVQQATTTLGQIGQQVVGAYRANPSAAVAADIMAASGSGVGQQVAQESGFGPVGQMVGGLMGGMAPAAVGATMHGSVQAIRRARANQGEAGAYGSIVDTLPPGGVSRLTDEIAGGATPGNVNARRRVVEILGEEMERAGGNLAQARQATVARIVQEDNVSPQVAARRIAAANNVHRESQLFFGEYPAVSASDALQRGRRAANVDMDEVGRVQDSVTHGRLDYLGNNGNTQSAAIVRNAIARRQEDLSPSLRDIIEGFGPHVQTGPRTTRPANITDAEDMIQHARQLAQADYRSAYAGPINNNVSLYWLPRMLAWHENRASTRSGDIERAIRGATDQFYVQTPNGRLAMATLQQLQDARGVVRGQISAYRRQGRDDLVHAVQPIYDHVTRIMTQMSPQWAQANRRWADMNFLRIGEDLGAAFATRAGPQFRQHMRDFERLAPEAQNIVRIHFLQKLYDRLDNLGDTHAVSKIFSNDHSRNMIRDLFGHDAAVSFTRAVRDQKVAEASQRMMGNSATHRRGQAQKQADAETGLETARQITSPGRVRDWLFERLQQIITERRNVPMAEILTTPMRDTAHVARHLHRLKEQEAILRTLSQPRQVPAATIGQLSPTINPMLEL